jgi:hypothetical protein
VISAKRVLMPWANIVPASRVTIDAIEPGEVTVSRGDNLVVSAEVRGVGDDNSVVLKYTTRDGRAVDKRLNMKVSPDGIRYEGRLPKDDGKSADVGLSESLTYRIEAGDARSLDYAVTVVPSPSILVERIDYDYPQYTGFVDRTVEGLGDIRAIEGTRVTIHARANGPVAEAHVDFDSDGRREVLMTAREANANASFLLELRDDRTTPKHASYVLRFMNAERRSNTNPVKHSIGVDPDYAPEASIVAPREEVLDVRLDETVAIEVEARDPDFAMADVRLHGEVSGRSVVDERLLTTGPKKRFTSRYQFTPKAHNLRAGDTVQYWIAASDNKSPSPNTTLTKKQVLRIVSPDPAQQPPPDRIAQRDRQQRQQPGDQQGEQGGQKRQQGEQQSKDGAGGENQPGEQQQGEQGSEQQKGEQQGQGSEGGANSQQQVSRDAQRSEGEGQEGETRRQGDSQESQSANGESQGGESQTGGENAGQRQDGQSGNQQQPGQQGGQSEGQGQSGDRQQQGGSNQQGGAKQQDGSNPNSKQTGAGAAGGEPSKGAQPAGTRQPDQPGAGSARPDSKQGQRSASGNQSKGDEQQPDAVQSPVSSEGDDDAEAFDRIQKHLQRDGQLNEDSTASDNQEQRQGKGETRRQGDTKQSPQETSADGKSQQQQQPGTELQGQQSEKSQESSGQQQQKDQGAEQKPGAEKTGEQSKDAQAAKEQTGEKGEESQSQGGEQSNTTGEPGAGDEKESQGAPNSQPNMKQGEKREQQGSQGEQSNKQEPPAGARGKKESDSQGEEGGDRAGGGEEGGGQRAPREGTGSAGQNQSADEGGGASDEKGKGVDSSSPGQDSASDNQKGTPGGETTGRGRKVKPGQDDEPGGTEPGEKPDGEQQQNAEPGNQAEDTGSNRGAPTGQGGNQGSEGTPAPRDGGTVPEGDKANLDYARQRTDLVLEKLSDQLKRKKIDEKMLKQLGWTEDDLRKFIARWESRKRAAEQNDAAGEAARRELDDALRSLGLRRGPMQTNRVKDDEMRDLKEGYRGPVPLEYQERLRAYNQGVSNSRMTNDE